MESFWDFNNHKAIYANEEKKYMDYNESVAEKLVEKIKTNFMQIQIRQKNSAGQVDIDEMITSLENALKEQNS